MINPTFISGILIVICTSECVNGVQIQFFQNRNFTGLSYESNSAAKCNNVPADKANVAISSIKTDTCLMVYGYPNCECSSRRFDPENIHGWNTAVRSFHVCNDDIGGPQLKIDITKYYDDRKPTQVPDVLESYTDVCACINIPQYVQNMTLWSINNYGNDFLAYFETNCSKDKWEPMLIPAGHWGEKGSRGMYWKIDSATKKTHKVQSIGPDPNSKYFKRSCNLDPINNKIFKSFRLENENKLVSLKRDIESCQQKHDRDFTSIVAKNEELVKQIQDLKIQYMNLEDSFEKLKDEFNYLIKINDHSNR